jgi:hypothetical protein
VTRKVDHLAPAQNFSLQEIASYDSDWAEERSKSVGHVGALIEIFKTAAPERNGEICFLYVDTLPRSSKSYSDTKCGKIYIRGNATRQELTFQQIK